MPKVSIIIPVYNAEKYLRECLDSVVNQTLHDIEIICIDDCSTDRSLEILEEFASKDKRIRIIKNQSNSGAPGAVKNIGLKEAKGLYIGIVDSDDYIDLNYFEILYNIAQKNRSDIAATLKIERFTENSKKISTIDCKNLQILNSYSEKKLLAQKSGSNWNKIYLREFLSKNNISCYTKRNIAEDNYLSMISIIMSNKISITSDTVYHYRKHENSVNSELRTDKDFLIFDVYKKIEEYLIKILKNKKHLNSSLDVLKIRELQDFQYFLGDIDKNYLKVFKEELKKQFPDIYKKICIDNLIVSLTSYPARINTVNKTIESLLKQSLQADKIILWLATEQFPNKEKDLPKQLLDLKEQGLIIDWYHDIKSYKKLIPTLKKFPDNIIVTVDDDLIYVKTWLEKLYKEFLKRPKEIHCHRAHKIKFDKNKNILPYLKWEKCVNDSSCSFKNFFTGAGGVLYPPNCLFSDVLNEDLFCKLCPNGDDIWFWAMAILKNTKINIVSNCITKLNYIEGTQEVCLWKINKFQNDEQLKNVFNYYPQILKKLNERFLDYNDYSFFEHLFSIKNTKNKKYKIISIFAIKIRIKQEKFRKLLFFGNKKSKKNKWYKVVYILGIKLSFRNKRKEKRVAEEKERKELKATLNLLKKQNKELKKEIKTQKKELQKQIKDLKVGIKTQQEELNNLSKKYDKTAKNANKYVKLLNMRKINKEKVYSEMNNRKDYCGITTEKRATKLIVSLTSYPDRMYDIHYCLYSLLNQTVKPDEVILWLGIEQFPNQEDGVPKEVLKLKNNGLTIKFTKDIKSYKKLIPALKEYPNDIIVTADDDVYYPIDWLEKLYLEYQKDGQNIICHRAHKIKFDENQKILPYLKWETCINDYSCSFKNFCTTGGGVLYSPNSLSNDILREDIFSQLCPNADDIWFWAMAILNNKKIKVVENPNNQITYINPERDLGYYHQETTLFSSNKLNNDKQLENVINYYPKILDCLLSFNSGDYWEARYKNNGNSGAGSYTNLAEFKAKIINSFVEINNINSVIEFGCGDGNQLSLFNFREYTGYDVSTSVLSKTKEKFINNKNYSFDLVQNYSNKTADLAMSLDVIFHLIEDDVFAKYMDNLFKASNRYIIIYSSNKNEVSCTHVKHRKFSDYIDANFKNWKLIRKIDNEFPFDESDQKHTSFADFYIYEKID